MITRETLMKCGKEACRETCSSMTIYWIKEMSHSLKASEVLLYLSEPDVVNPGT